jgi:ubiquinone/menaquinone biosynthesis C-methylase UbiE
MDEQKRTIVDQFTKQASPFAGAAAITDRWALELLLAATHAGANDTVLDVACGPGIVVCAYAEVVEHATGVDLVPAMIEKARSLQRERGLGNVSWETADVTALPYSDASFSIVTSRYAFHHLERPRDVLFEMKRVCEPGGRVALVDVAASEDSRRAEAFNQMERLRDPSHVRALHLAEMEALFREVGLPDPQITRYELELELESLLKRSFPKEGDADRVRALIRGAVGNDDMGIRARRTGETVAFAYPIAILVSVKGT